MKVIGINGSPRKQWNTGILVQKALEGAASKGAETKLVNLYGLNFKGCASCFACKLKGGKSYGRCAVNDGLKPLLAEIETAGALILGTPIYFGTVTGEMRCFLERLLFPYMKYAKDYTSLFTGTLRAAWIFTMNLPEDLMRQFGYGPMLQNHEDLVKRMCGHCESLIVNDTVQFDDYSKYENTLFDGETKNRRRAEVFPADCQKAFDMGARFAGA